MKALSWNCSSLFTSLGSILNSNCLAISPMAIVISSNEVLDPSKSSIGFGIHFFQTFVDVDILTSFYESKMFLMHLERWVLSRSFRFTLSTSIGKDWRQGEKGTTEDEIIGWHHWLNGTSLSKLWEIVKDREAWYASVHGVTKSWTWLNNWTTTNLPEEPYGSCILAKCVSYIIRLESLYYSLILGLQNEYYGNDMKIILISLYISNQAFVWLTALSMRSKILKGIFFSEENVSTVDLNIPATML